MSKAKAIRPLVIILDSLDQLEPANNSHSLEWLPAVLKANVKIVLSTLEEEEYECFPILQVSLKPVRAVRYTATSVGTFRP